MNDLSKISLTLGDSRLEIEGDKTFVEQKLKELLPVVLGEAKVADKQPRKKKESSGEEVSSKSRSGQTLKSFMDQKAPQNSSQAIAVVMYYKREYENQADLSADEIRNALRQGGYRPPGAIAQALVDCKRRFGYIDRGSAKGMWKLVHQGEALVEFDLPGDNS